MKLALNSAAEFAHTGYGSMGVSLIKGLTDIGVDLWVPKVGEYGKYVPKNYRTVLWAVLPGHTSGEWEGQRSCLWTMWESDHLPESMRCRLGNFATVIVPNDSNLDIFGRYHPHVVKIPLGYDSTVWTYQPRPEPTDTFRFLFCGAGIGDGSRKGSDLVFKAFRSAFPHWDRMDPSPRLVTKSQRLPSFTAPWLESHTGGWPVEKVVELYRSCDAMVLPSRGEGWGYHPQQAVATGMPAVVSEIPGHTEYSHLPGFLNVPTKPAKAAYFIYGEAGNWWEPDLDALVDGMRTMYADLPYWRAEAERGGDMLRASFTHRHMAEGVVAALGADNLVACKTGKWRQFRERLYPLEVTRRMESHDWCVGESRSYLLEPGRRYWVDANVRQVMLDAGYAANADEDHAGLLPEEVDA